MDLFLDLKTEKDYWLGTYEPDLLSIISKGVEQGSVAYDIGANIGYLSLALAKAVGTDGVVFAFEALPENIKRLKDNLRVNQKDLTVNIIQAAVVETSMDVDFYIGPSRAMGKAMGSKGRSGYHGKTIKVKGISLDDFVYEAGNPPPAVVKMDIEGGEVLALQGMTRLLNENPPTIFIELHGEEAANVVWDNLVRAGYHLFRIETGLPKLITKQELNWKEYLVAYP
jgi:FkbM family methyltransferase